MRKKRYLKIKQRKFKIQQIDGLPKKFVSPPKHILSRIREENKKVQDLADAKEAERLARAKEIEEEKEKRISAFEMLSAY